MGTHTICLYKEVDKKYIDSNLMTTELLDCALIGACAVIRLNTVNNVERDVKHQMQYLRLCMLGKNFSRRHLEMFFLFN